MDDEKIKIREAVAVEGRYDAHAVRAAADAFVVELNGFSAFRNPETVQHLRDLAVRQGLILLTDSDEAGALIRNRMRGMMPPGTCKIALVPPREGKERRKRAPGAAGLLGVEAMPPEVIRQALRQAGATILEEKEAAQTADAERRTPEVLSRTALYADGLLGGANSAQKRRALLRALDLPENLSAHALLGWINAAPGGAEVYRAALAQINTGEGGTA